MSLEAITARIAIVNQGISGLRRVSEDPPDTISDADVPWMFAMVNEGDLTSPVMGVGRSDHRLFLQIWGRSVGQGESGAVRINELKPFVTRVRAAYNADIRLQDLTNVSWTQLTGYRFSVETYAGQAHALLEFDLFVREQESETHDT